MTGRYMTKEMLKKWADWEDIYNDLADLLSYWEHQSPSTEQKQNVVSVKETRRLIEELL